MKKILRTSLLGLLFMTPLLSFATCGDGSASVAEAPFCIVPESQTPLNIYTGGVTSTDVTYRITSNSTRTLRHIRALLQENVSVLSYSEGCDKLLPLPRNKQELLANHYVCRITFHITGTVTNGPTICTDGLCQTVNHALGFNVRRLPVVQPTVIDGPTDITITGPGLNPYALFSYVFGLKDTITLRITNNSTVTAYNVLFDVFRPGWGLVVKSGVCETIVAGGFCDIHIRSNGKQPFAPENLYLVGSNLNNITPRYFFGFGFTINGYIVYLVDAFNKFVHIMSDFDENFVVSGAQNNIPWYVGSVYPSTNITELTNRGKYRGHLASRDVYDFYRFLIPDTSYAEGLCHGKLVQNGCPSNCTVTEGTWYVPPVCELGFGNPGVFGCEKTRRQNIANAASVLGSGPTNLVTTGNYWSITLDSSVAQGTQTWSLGFTPAPTPPALDSTWASSLGTTATLNVRCVRRLSYVDPDEGTPEEREE